LTLFQDQPYLQSIVSDGTYRIDNIDETTAGLFRQGFDKARYVVLESTGAIGK